MSTWTISKLLMASSAALAIATAPGKAADDVVGLITKTNTNPFFVKMKEGFDAKAKELGLVPQAFAGKIEGDNDSQVVAIERLIAAGAKGILIVPSDPAAIVPSVKRARDAGIIVITLDTPLDPVTAADAHIGTDNLKAGQLIGQWAKATLGDKAASAKIVTLDLEPYQPTVDYQRHNGFLSGFGIPVPDVKHYSQSDSPQIVGSDVTAGSTEGGRKAMENILQRTPDFDVVYAANELSAQGGYLALKAAGKETNKLIVDIDGGCGGVKLVKDGIVGADTQQYPLLMAADGVAAIADYLKTKTKPVNIDSGERLITDHPVPGVPSITTEEAAKLCWG